MCVYLNACSVYLIYTQYTVAIQWYEIIEKEDNVIIHLIIK